MAKIVNINGVPYFDLEDGTATTPATRIPMAENEPVKPTFGAGIIGLTLAATPTDILTIRGAAGKIIRVKSIIVNGNSGTNGAYPLSFIRRSAPNTGAAGVAVQGYAHDTADGAPAASLLTWNNTTGNPTVGAAVGTLHAGRLVAANASNLDRLSMQYSWLNDKGLVLRGVNDLLALNMGGAALAAATTVDIDLLWTEENA